MKPSLAFPIFLIVVGVVWLLRSLQLFPATADIVAVVLAVTGVAIFVLEGINKQTLVFAPMLVYTGGAVYAYGHYPVKLSTLFAAGMVISGCLMLLARSDIVPDGRSKRLPKK